MTRHSRILYLIDEVWSSLGGSEQHLLWLLQTIPEQDFDKHLIIFSSIHTADPALDVLNPIILGRTIGGGPKNWLRRLRFVARYLKEHNIDVVHAFSPMGELVAILAAKLAGRGRVLANRRDCGYDRRLLYRWIFWLAKLLKTQYIANSEAARQAAFQNDGTPIESIVVIRNPVSRKRLEDGLRDPLPRHSLTFLQNSPDERIVGMIATVRPIKDHGTLIKAAKIVLEKYPATWFVFVGEQDATHKALLEKLAETEGVATRIVWYGKLANPMKILQHFDIAVLSTHSESFSNAVLEYAAADKPIIVSNVGGLGEIVEDGQTGQLVPPENPRALADGIIHYLDHPDYAKRLGTAAKEFVLDRYDERKILVQYVNRYREMAET